MDISSDNKARKVKVMNQLVQGHELATMVQQLLSQQPGAGLGPAVDLAAKFLGSYNDTVSALLSLGPISSSSSSLVTAVEGSQNASCDDNDGKLEDSGDSRKRLGPVKGKRGCYKRKKRSETWTVESTVLDQDAFSWRKYGQKQILNAKFPRSYFRCTHKYTQGCKATKQVQKLEVEPRMFSITYIGNHTCNTKEETPKIKPCDHHHDEIIMDSGELKSPSLTTTTSMKEEDVHHGSSTEKDLSLVWPEIVFEDDHHHHYYHHHHEAIYGFGETSASISALCSTDLMVFGAGSDFGLSDNDQLSIFDSCSNLA